MFIRHHMRYPFDKCGYNPRTIWYWSRLYSNNNLYWMEEVKVLVVLVVRPSHPLKERKCNLSFNWIFHFNYDIKLTMARKTTTLRHDGSGLVFNHHYFLCCFMGRRHKWIMNLMALFWYGNMCLAGRWIIAETSSGSLIEFLWRWSASDILGGIWVYKVEANTN